MRNTNNVDRDGVSKALKEGMERYDDAQKCEFVVKVNNAEYYAPKSDKPYVGLRMREALEWGMTEAEKNDGLSLRWDAFTGNGEPSGKQRVTIEVVKVS